MPILVSVGFCLEDMKMSGQLKKILKLRGEDWSRNYTFYSVNERNEARKCQE